MSDTLYIKGVAITPIKIMTDGKFTDEYKKFLLERDKK